MNWETLMCFGDSITIGARSYNGYPEYAGNFLEKSIGNNWNVINHAVSGYTTIELHRLVSAHFWNLKQFAPGITTILIGTNDVKTGTSETDFAISYKQLVIKSLLISPYKNVVLIRIPSFPKNVAYPYTYEMNARVDRFNYIISEIATQNNLRCMGFSLSDDDFYDGVHFNAQGAMNAGRQLASFIEADKGINMSLPELMPLTLKKDV